MKKPNCKCYICKRNIYRNPNLKLAKPTCSVKCRSILNRIYNGKYVYCDNCNKFFYKKNSRISKLNFCCSYCHKNFRSYNIDINYVIDCHNNGMYDKDIAKIYGCSRSLITIIINNNLTHNDRRIKINDIDLRLRISNSNKGKRTGKANHRFKGDSCYKNLARGLFSSISKVFLIKNNYTCRICNNKSGTKNVHHIKPFSVIIEEFLDLNKKISLENFSSKLLKYEDFIDESNLVVLCEQCHKDIHTKENPVLSPFQWKSATTIENTLNISGSE